LQFVHQDTSRGGPSIAQSSCASSPASGDDDGTRRPTRVSDGPINVSVAVPDELGARELARWHTMQSMTPNLASPFLSPEFASAVAQVRPNARVAILERDHEIVGFLPYEQGRLGAGRPIGAGVCDCQGLIHMPGLLWEPQMLLQACRLSLWKFDHLLAGQAPFQPYHSRVDRTYVVDLAEGYDTYLQNRLKHSRRTLKTTLQKERKLASEIGDVTFSFDAQDRATLDTLIRWKSAQYTRTGWSDRFAERWAVRLIHALSETRTRGCSGTLSVLRAGDRIVACHFGLRSESVLCCWFPTYDVSLAKYSPGLILHLHMAKGAADLGVRQMDLGKGEEMYKNTLKTRDLAIAEGCVARRSTLGYLRRTEWMASRSLRNFVLAHSQLRSLARWSVKQMKTRRRAD
jgi:CelD/BcsL family acetyltransferase involved in cellulose biosynthesis